MITDRAMVQYSIVSIRHTWQVLNPDAEFLLILERLVVLSAQPILYLANKTTNTMQIGVTKVLTMLGFGTLIATLKVIYLLFNFYNILDVLVFLSAGYVLGRTISGGYFLWGVVLSLPCMLLDSFFVYRLGFSNVMSGIGTSYLMALAVVPLSACMGVWLRRWKDYSHIGLK